MASGKQKFILKYKEPGTCRDYLFKSNTIFRINGNILYQGESENRFKLNLLETGTHNKFDVSILESKSSSGYDFFGEFKSLIDEMKDIKNHAILKAKINGPILEILNKQEWVENWIGLKKRLINYDSFKKLSSEQKTEIIEKGDIEYDREYTHADDLVKSSFYRFLFASIHHMEYELEQRKIISERFETSGIIQSFQLPCQSYIELDSYDTSTNVGMLVLRDNLDISRLDESAIQTSFKESYPFIEEDYKRYTYDQFTSYEVDFKNGFINNVKNSSYEAINASVEIETENEIIALP